MVNGEWDDLDAAERKAKFLTHFWLPEIVFRRLCNRDVLQEYVRKQDGFFSSALSPTMTWWPQQCVSWPMPLHTGSLQNFKESAPAPPVASATRHIGSQPHCIMCTCTCIMCG